MPSTLGTRLIAHGETGEVAALVSIYAADRADQAATVNNAMAMLGAGVAYATAILAFYDQIVGQLSGAVVAVLPFPLWMVVLYHAVLAATSMRRSVSIGIIENLLLANVVLHDRDSLVGYQAVEQVLNIFRARWPHRVASMITYSGTGFLTVGFTTYVLSQDPGLSSTLVTVSAVCYVGLAVVWSWCWLASLHSYRRDHRDLHVPPKPDQDA